MNEFAATHERRKFPRYNAPICYRSASLFSRRKPLVDIGLGGMRIYSDDEFKIGKRLEIELLLPDDKILSFTAKVVWQKALPEKSVAKYDVGLQFLNVPEEGRDHLSTVLKHCEEDLS